MPKKDKLTPIPPGEYTITLERVRKIRNKDAYRFHYRMADGSSMTQVMGLKPDDPDV